jgi:hypothetical protein
LKGRVLAEALAGGGDARAPGIQFERSAAANGRVTILQFQEFGGVRYLDAACFAAATQRSCQDPAEGR